MLLMRLSIILLFCKHLVMLKLSTKYFVTNHFSKCTQIQKTKTTRFELNPTSWSKSNLSGFTIFSKEIQIATS